ncbi:MAG: glycosyltransferase family 2 protein [Ferruginibacter sp.]
MDFATNLFAYKNHFETFAHVKSHLVYGELSTSPVFVSVVIPTYKRANLLKDTIDSAINQQGFEDYEIIIVDNDPDQSFKSATQLLVESYQHPKIRYYKHDENIGMFPNWNRGIELARGEWVTLLHDDDICFSYYLREMSGVLRKNPHVEALKGKQLYWKDDQTKSILDIENDFPFTKCTFRKVRKIDNYFANSIGPTGIFYKKKNLLKLGGFSPDFYPSSDYVLGNLYLFYFNTFITHEYLGVYRWAENESLRYETKVKMIEQGHIIRIQYRKLLKLNNVIWEKLIFLITKASISTILLPYNKELGENLKGILDYKINRVALVNMFYRICRVDLTLRDKTFFPRLSRKFKSAGSRSGIGHNF